MKSVIVMLAMVIGTAAHADGFLCEGLNTALKFKVFNSTNANIGTRSVAVMVISNPLIASPNKTIAKFSSENQTLNYMGYGKYVAKVDLRYNDSGRKGELIAGTKLGELSTIALTVKNFSYNSQTVNMARDADHLAAKISYTKRNGEVLQEAAECARYTKN